MAPEQQMYDAANDNALFKVSLGPIQVPFLYTGVASETSAYRTSAWIGIPLQAWTPIYDIVGPDACKFLESVCVNDFSKLRYTGLRHAVICNERGKLLTDGVVIRLAEDRYRTYWMNPPIAYLCEQSDLDVHGEELTGTEYFIQIEGEKSLEILEDAFQQDLHDIRFAKRREIDFDGHHVNVIRLGMSGNLAYEIHGPIAEGTEVYNLVWESGKKFGARQLGFKSYNGFNHTEAGFPNIHIHYPLPWFESGEGLANWCTANPLFSLYNMNRNLVGSVGDDLETRFVTPYDIGLGNLVKFNHDFIGREALEKIAANPERTPVTLEWNADDVAEVWKSTITLGATPADDISVDNDYDNIANFSGNFKYVANKVFFGDQEIGMTTGRIRSASYNCILSLGYISPACAVEGNEVTVLWGTPGTPQFKVRATVRHFPYNIDMVRNEDRDVEDIPHRF